MFDYCYCNSEDCQIYVKCNNSSYTENYFSIKNNFSDNDHYHESFVIDPYIHNMDVYDFTIEDDCLMGCNCLNGTSS